jgi:hypothetical protein
VPSPERLALGAEPTDKLKAYRVRTSGVAQLRHLLGLVVSNVQVTIAGIEFTLKHRPPRDLEAIEHALLVQLGNVEDALAHVRRMKHRRDQPVTAHELASHDEAQQEALRP